VTRVNPSNIGHRISFAVLVVAVIALTNAPPARSAVRPRTQATASQVRSACGLVTTGPPRVLSASNPCIVVTAVHESFRVALPIGFHWGAMTSTSRVVRVTSGVSPAAGGLKGTVTGLRTGLATLHSAGTMVCRAGVACPALARLWSLVVVVNVASSAPVSLPLSTSDNGRQITLRLGDRLNLHLVGPSIYVWTPATASNSAVLNRVSADPGNSVSRAVFVARGPGRSTVTAVDNPRCYPQCLPPSRLFQVRVVVTK